MQTTLPLNATDIVRAIERGDTTCEDVVHAFLDRVAAREDAVRAWAYIDPDNALAQARALDRGPRRGPLHGVPVGVKDVFLTADQPTQYGSPIYQGHSVPRDAAVVALARAAGAVVMGKTVTTEFATPHPGPTRNPLDSKRTPGGSSSGSAAAVADGMVPLGFATQTAGSTIRPASFCGVVGYKPTFGLAPRAGVVSLSETLDTIGFMAQSVEDAALFAAAASGRDPQYLEVRADAAPQIGLCRGPEWARADPATQAAVEDAAVRLGRTGAVVREVDLPDDFDVLSGAHWTVLAYETTRALSYERIVHGDRISPELHEIFARGLGTTDDEYLAARHRGALCRRRLDGLFGEWQLDVLIAPAATGEAPVGLETTGDPVLNLLWTFMHTPSVSIPVLEGPSGMPVGLQVIGPRDADAATLGAAEWIRRALDV